MAVKKNEKEKKNNGLQITCFEGLVEAKVRCATAQEKPKNGGRERLEKGGGGAQAIYVLCIFLCTKETGKIA